MKIEKIESKDILQDKIDKIFMEQAKKNNVDTNYQSFAYALKNGDGEIVGGVHGCRLFREIRVKELSIDESARGKGMGKKLLNIVEKEICNEKCDCMVLSTSAFQNAIDFYKKCGFELEFVRESQDPKFNRCYMVKKLK